MSWSYTTGGPF